MCSSLREVKKRGMGGTEGKWRREEGKKKEKKTLFDLANLTSFSVSKTAGGETCLISAEPILQTSTFANAGCYIVLQLACQIQERHK